LPLQLVIGVLEMSGSDGLWTRDGLQGGKSWA